MNLEEKLKLLKGCYGKSFGSLTKDERSLFNDRQIVRLIKLACITKCPYCKHKFCKPLDSKEGLNGEMLFHIKETHGYDPETFMEFLKIIIKKND